MSQPSPHEQKRYSAVALPCEPNSLDRLLRRGIWGRPKGIDAPDAWNAKRVRLVSSKRYSTSEKALELMDHADGYGYPVLVAEHRSQLLLVASPYVRVLKETVASFTSDDKAPRFFAPAIDHVYDFARTAANLRARQAIISIDGDPELSTVTLSGKSPLHSRLHGAITDTSSPYAIRIGVTFPRRAAGLYLDKFGQMDFYLSYEDRLRNVLRVLGELQDAQLFDEVETYPFARRDVRIDQQA